MNTSRFVPTLLALAASLCCSVAKAQTTTAPAAQLSRIEVTGTRIKRLSDETASPISVYTRESIKETGANSLRQVLDTLTAFDTGTLRDDGSRNSFAAGASGASMRGLGKAATLVLVNGRRIANFAFADGGKESFVNLDAIPADAIERIEVLKDSASAAYGSDAMAGVINIITRRNFQGVAGSASYQQSSNPNVIKQGGAGLVAGFGDYERDRFNVFANLDIYKREGYALSDVIDAYPEWHKRLVNPAFGDPSLLSYPGNLNESGKGVRQALKSCPASQVNAGGLCTTNINGITQSSDPTTRANFYSGASFKVDGSTRAFAELSYSKIKVDYLALPATNSAGSPTNWFDGFTKQSQSVVKPKLPVGHPDNPFAFPVGIDYRFMDANLSWASPAEVSQYRVMAGLEGQWGNWDYEIAIGRVGADGSKKDRGADRNEMPKAISSGTYKLGGQNSDELLAKMFPAISSDGNNHQNFVDAKLSGELMALPAGALQFALGAEHRSENVYIKSSDNVMQAQIIGRGSLWVEGQRSLNAAYVELNAPVIKGLELNGALRLDKASGFKSHVSPKLGVRFEASDKLLLRGTVAGGFRAPNIPETLGKVGLTGFFNNTLDPKRCDTATAIRDILKTGNSNDKNDATTAYNSGCLTSIPAMISANAALKPETSNSLTLGLVFHPIKDVKLSVDYFKITRSDEIASRDVSYVLAREGQPAYKDLLVRNPISEQDLRLAARANTLKPGANLSWSVGNIQSLLLNYENFGKTQTSGVDAEISGSFKLGELGSVYLGLETTYLLSYRGWDIDADTWRPNTAGLRGTPRNISVLRAQWKQANWRAGLSLNYVSKQALNNDETDEATWNLAGCTARIKPGNLPCYIASDMRVDLNAAYTGIKNWRFGVNVRNLLNDDLPVNLRSGYTLRPRQLKVSAEFEF